jgi:hypothetical protein
MDTKPLAASSTTRGNIKIRPPVSLFVIAILLILIGLWFVHTSNRAAGAVIYNSYPTEIVYLPLIARSGLQISGIVYDEAGPLAGATVRIQATQNSTLTDHEGRFTLSGLTGGAPVTVSAWKEGYYCAKQENVTPPVANLSLEMRLYQTNDNPEYTWILPEGDNSCYSCKAGLTQVWLDNDAHSRAASNERFLTMYNGTDVFGNQSPLTRYACSPDYGCVPLPPDLNQPYYGPGYKLDFPYTAGNCAACHIPGAAVNSPYGTDPNTVSGADTFGVHCDFCHKIANVTLNPDTDLPYPNMPGVISMDIRRPFSDDPLRYQLFFGTFDDDNVPEEDTYLPLISESRYCAPCHSAEFWGVTVYNSYGEWLESPYSDLTSGTARTCQECHMPAPTMLEGAPITNIAPGTGGVERDPLTIHAHTFPGAGSIELLQNAVTMTATARNEDRQVVVEVQITNDKTGHSVPTDSPLRHLILLVQATDADGSALFQLTGPTVPEWGGVGDPALGYYAGLPGTAYAKVLQELWTQVSPSGAYWNQTRLVSDNRIAAFASDTSVYTFTAPPGGRANIQVTLLFRRAFIQLADWKSWVVPDIMMETITISMPDQSPSNK